MKNWVLPSVLGLAAVLLGGAAYSTKLGWGGESKAPQVFLIGNSLTQGVYPKGLDGGGQGRVQWHIYCGKNLKFIRENPDAHCVDSSIPWPEALVDGSYDFLCVQPFPGTTLAEDTEIIAEWAVQQPQATLVVHTAWTFLAEFPALYEANRPDGPMTPCPAYFHSLVGKLQERLPGREIRMTNAHKILYAIHQDASADRGPFKSLVDLGVDEIHLKKGPGRYLTHNAMRLALGEPLKEDIVELDPEVRAYLNEKLVAHGWRPHTE